LARENLDPAVALKVREQLQALADHADLSEQDERRRWRRIQQLAPGLWTTAEPVIEMVLTAWFKSQR